MAQAAAADRPVPPGHGVVDLDAEVAYWRGYYARNMPALDFRAYEPAIRLGIQACVHAHGRSFEEMDSDLGEHYEVARARSALEWKYAKAVARASWLRIEERAAS